MGKLWRADNLYSFLHSTNLFLSEDDKFKHPSIGRSFHLSGIFLTLFPFPALFTFKKKLVTALIRKMRWRCRSGNKAFQDWNSQSLQWGVRAGVAGVSIPALTSCPWSPPQPALGWFVFLQTHRVGVAAKMVPKTIGLDSARLVAVKNCLQKYKWIF